MSCSSFFREEFEQETSSTRKILATLPEANFGWKPHEKSMTLGQLAGHVAEQPFWISLILETDSFELMPDGTPAFECFLPKTREQLLATFDANVKQAKELLTKVEDEQLKQTWTLLFKEKPIVTNHRYGMMRFLAMNHLIHHRAQLTVYLRLINIPIPGIYGPSADDPEIEA